MAKPRTRQRRQARCPICGRPPATEVRPFCSPRCRDVDLARWLGGAYAIPVVEDDEDLTPGSDESR